MIINIGELVCVFDKFCFKVVGKLVEVVSIQFKYGVKDEDFEVKVCIIFKDGKFKFQFGYVCVKFFEFVFLKVVFVKGIEMIDILYVGVDFKWKFGQVIKFIVFCEFNFIKDDGRVVYICVMCGYIID